MTPKANIGWKMYWINNKNKTDIPVPESFGFKSKNTPPPCRELENFESDLLDIFESITFRHTNDNFQNKLKKDISNIRKSNKVFVFADKTNNIYTMSPDTHNKLLKENVTKSYQKAPQLLEAAINSEAKNIASYYKVEKRAEKLAESPAFITLKDHKENFHQKHQCRLINPCKSEIGAISKYILDHINSKHRDELKVIQWKNTDQAHEWFSSIKNKNSCSFIQMDIKEFYQSITREILDNAFNFAKNYTEITEKEMRTIFDCRKSLLFSNEEAWKKKDTHDCFDVTMGSYDGAEICELVGIFILYNLSQIANKCDIGLYRDDGLMLLRNSTKRTADIARKKVIKTFKDIGFDIEIIINMKAVDFLDVTLDLISETYRPYKKPNDRLQYVHVSSNHPACILRQLPVTVNKRLGTNSSNEAVFEKAKPEYEEALRMSGYKNPNLFFYKDMPKKCIRIRTRNTIWFNPPYNKNVVSTVAKTFLKLIDKHFTKANNLYKIFNRNNVKVSYSCTENVSSIINSHNKKIMSIKSFDQLPCNCREKKNCPLQGNCRIPSVVYKCEVIAPSQENKVYIGITEGEFKLHFNGHKQSFNNVKYKNSTTLSTYIWNLKEKNIAPSIKWSIITRVSSYSNKSKSCPLCLREKLEILCFGNKSKLLNKRTEIVAKCRHMNKYLIANHKSKKD
jgi:hypothetical protein